MFLQLRKNSLKKYIILQLNQIKQHYKSVVIFILTKSILMQIQIFYLVNIAQYLEIPEVENLVQLHQYFKGFTLIRADY